MYKLNSLSDIHQVNALLFGINNKGEINKKEDLDAFFDHCITVGETAFFPEGTYHIPKGYYYDWGTLKCSIKGDNAVFTTSDPDHSLTSVKAVKRVDLTLPRPKQSGYYKVDVVGNTHESWDNEYELDDYVFVHIFGDDLETDIQFMLHQGYVLDLDLSKPAPTEHGLYVVYDSKHNWGGGFEHTEMWNTGVKVTLGSIVQFDGEWSRYNPGTFIYAEGDIEVKGITFDNFCNFIFFPRGIEANKKLDIDCNFKDCTRVFATESTGGGIDWLSAINPDGGDPIPLYDIIHKVKPFIGDFAGYSFKEFKIKGKFEYIHTSIAWAIPYCERLEIEADISHCYTTIAGFHHSMGESPGRTHIKADVFRWRNYGFNAKNREVFKIHSNAFMEQSRFVESNGIFIFGVNNFRAMNNYLEPYVHEDIESVGFWLKGGREINQNIISKNTTKGGCLQFRSVGIQNQSENFILDNNFIQGSGSNFFLNGDTHIDENKVYKIPPSSEAGQNLTWFKSVVERYSEDINEGDFTWFDRRTNRWEKLTAGGSSRKGAVFYSPITDSPGKIEIKRGTYDAFHALEFTGPYTIEDVEISGIDLSNAVAPISSSNQPKRVKIHNNPQLTFLGGVKQNSQEDFEFSNNRVLKNFLGQIKIATNGGDILLENNVFIKDSKIPLSRMSDHNKTVPDFYEAIHLNPSGGSIISVENKYLYEGAQRRMFYLTNFKEFTSIDDKLDLKNIGALTGGIFGDRIVFLFGGVYNEENKSNIFIYEAKVIGEKERNHYLVDFQNQLALDNLCFSGGSCVNGIPFEKFIKDDKGSLFTNIPELAENLIEFNG